MFREDSAEEQAFRREFRRWVEANLAPELRGWSTRPPFALAMTWYRRLYEGGYIAPHWPTKYGGMGATLNQQLVIREELARAGAPEVTMQGLNHIGPLLMRFGNAAQKALHLPRILSGEVVWCQGYSEPGSGSDLASVRSRATVDGEELVVNGHKIWTTWAHHADWMFALVRTDPDAPRKQAGVSFILIDLETPGIRIRPIVTLAGDDEFAEVFLDNVRVPMTNLVGEINDGWRIANSLLSHERLGSSNPGACLDGLERIKKVARATGAADDPGFRDRLAAIELDVISVAAMFAHAVSLFNAEQTLGPDSSIMKLWGSETLQRIADLLLEAAGSAGPGLDRLEAADGPVDVGTFFRQTRRATIYGGTSEIQRNIVAKRVLGLPSG